VTTGFQEGDSWERNSYGKGTHELNVFMRKGGKRYGQPTKGRWYGGRDLRPDAEKREEGRNDTGAYLFLQEGKSLGEWSKAAGGLKMM